MVIVRGHLKHKFEKQTELLLNDKVEDTRIKTKQSIETTNLKAHKYVYVVYLKEPFKSSEKEQPLKS